VSDLKRIRYWSREGGQKRFVKLGTLFGEIDEFQLSPTSPKKPQTLFFEEELCCLSQMSYL
jgi:hypothetical protein